MARILSEISQQPEDLRSREALLRDVVHHLRETWWSDDVGLVAAGVFAPQQRSVIRTSRSGSKGTWCHAERAALDAYKGLFGEPPADSIVVVTLSPCIKPVSATRIGGACAPLLAFSGVQRLHVGAIDTHDSAFLGVEYARLRLSITTTQDPWLQRICRRLLRVFHVYGDRVNDDLLRIKRDVGEAIFSSDEVPTLDESLEHSARATY